MHSDVLANLISVAREVKRRRLGFGQHRQLKNLDFNPSGRFFGIGHAFRPLRHLSIDPHHPFRTKFFGESVQFFVSGGDHQLDFPRAVAQVKKNKLAVVPSHVNPSEKLYGFA